MSTVFQGEVRSSRDVQVVLVNPLVRTLADISVMCAKIMTAPRPQRGVKSPFSTPLVCTGARRSSAICGANERAPKRRFGHLGGHASHMPEDHNPRHIPAWSGIRHFISQNACIDSF